MQRPLKGGPSYSQGDWRSYYTLADVLTLQVTKKQYSYQGTTIGRNGVVGAQYGKAYQYLNVFHDVDVQPGPRGDHSCDYIGNIIVFGTCGSGFADGKSNLYRNIGAIKRASELMTVWDAPVNLTQGLNGGSNDGIDGQSAPAMGETIDGKPIGNTQIVAGYSWIAWDLDEDAYFEDWGRDQNYYSIKPTYSFAYGNPISIGANWNGPSSTYQAAGLSPVGASLSFLKATNHDIVLGSGGLNAQKGCEMRFRHMNDSQGNFLFLDGHVESRRLHEVFLKDICSNVL